MRSRTKSWSARPDRPRPPPPPPPSISGGGDRRRAGAGWGPGGGPGWSSPGGRRSDHCTHVRQGQLVGTRAAGEQRWESRRNRPEGSRTEVSASLAYAIAGSIDPDPTIRAAQRDTHIWCVCTCVLWLSYIWRSSIGRSRVGAIWHMHASPAEPAAAGHGRRPAARRRRC
jgi:hypothetical protein